MGQYRPAAVQQVTVDGKVYGIPEFYSVRVLMVSNTALKDAGPGLAVPGALGDRVPGLHRRPDDRQPGPVLHGIVLMSLWTLGSTTIIYLAALNNVPRDLDEAARVDGPATFGCSGGSPCP